MSRSAAGNISGCLEQYSFSEIQTYVSEKSVLILPIGGNEPLGPGVPSGAESVLCRSLARELTSEYHLLSAPVLPFSCSVPFMAFPGTAGIKPRTFINVLLDMIRCYVFQGFSKLFLINVAPFNQEPLRELIKRIAYAYPQVKAAVFDFNSAAAAEQQRNFDRQDKLLLSVISFISPEMIQREQSIEIRNTTSVKDYRTWRKRGRDPQKLRTLFPSGVLENEEFSFSTEVGKEYFGKLLKAAGRELKQLMESDESGMSNA